jgi:hypothetical protein
VKQDLSLYQLSVAAPAQLFAIPDFAVILICQGCICVVNLFESRSLKLSSAEVPTELNEVS